MRLRMNFAVSRAASCVLAAAAMLSAAPPAPAKVLSQWVQLGPDGSASVRAIVDDDACPAVTFDGAAAPMNLRSAPAQSFGNVKPAQFPVRGCEAAVPPGAAAKSGPAGSKKSTFHGAQP